MAWPVRPLSSGCCQRLQMGSSVLQRLSQPSWLRKLPSSHCSAGSSTPLPHGCSGSGFLISDGSFHQYATTWDGLSVHFYRDGVHRSSTSHTVSNLNWDKTNEQISVLTMGTANNDYHQAAASVRLAFLAARVFSGTELASIWADPDQLVR